MPRRPPVRLSGRRGGKAFVRLAVATLLGMTCWMTGCGGPCEDLRERVCASSGENAVVCQSLHAANAAPHAGDRAACAAGVAYLDELKRGR